MVNIDVGQQSSTPDDAGGRAFGGSHRAVVLHLRDVDCAVSDIACKHTDVGGSFCRATFIEHDARKGACARVGEESHSVRPGQMKATDGVPVAPEGAGEGCSQSADRLEVFVVTAHVNVCHKLSLCPRLAALVDKKAEVAEVEARGNLIDTVHLSYRTVREHLVHPRYPVADKVADAVHLALP